MNILIAGIGSIGRKHADAIRSVVPDATIYGLRSSRSADHIDGITDIYSIDGLHDTKLDFAIISTPTALHATTVNSLLPLKCPLLIEKPLAHNLTDAKAIATAIDASGVTAYIGCNLRFLGCIRFIKNNLARPGHSINEVNAYCGSYLPDWRKGVDFRKVYSSRPELGGGVHIDLIHELDYLYWMFGKPDHTTRTIRNRSSLGIEAPDYANYCMHYKQFCASVVLNYYRRDPRRTLEIVWDDDTWIADLRNNSVTSALTGCTLFNSDDDIPVTMADQIRYMVELSKSPSGKSANTCNDALEVLKICLNNETDQ
ncbi:MAG: Gfo/Idh/MocA family oxidoreductase [Muribaculaceae bacterium]|nr:Gfo/Idh/MocA family oxidoreductase [Muribaculaceae bacterium]